MKRLDKERIWVESPQPLHDEVLPVKKLTTEMLPQPWRSYIEDQADLMQSPLEFIAAPMLVAASAVLGNKIAMCPKARDDGWQVVPNLWGMLVGPPGSMKSPCQKKGLSFLRRLQDEDESEHDARTAENAAKQRVLKRKKAKLEDEMDKCENEAQNAEIAKAIVALEAEMFEPPCKRRIVGECTQQALTKIMSENPSGMFVERDELNGLFASWLRPDRMGERSLYLEGWAGDGAYCSDTIGRGAVKIPKLTLSVFGNIQPHVLETLVRHTVRGSRESDGLLQRFQVLVFPDAKDVYAHVDRPPKRQAEADVMETFRRLDHVVHSEAAPFLRFSPEAQAMFDGWRCALEERIRRQDEVPAFTDHLSKFRSLVPSLSLIVELLVGPGSTKAVGLSALKLALDMADVLESQAKRAYHLGDTACLGAHQLLEGVASGALKSQFSLRDLLRTKKIGLPKKDRAVPALTLLVARGYLQHERFATGNHRPSDMYFVHPQLLPSGDRPTL